MNCFIDQPLVKKPVCAVETDSDKTGFDKPSHLHEKLVVRLGDVSPLEVKLSNENLTIRERSYE